MLRSYSIIQHIFERFHTPGSSSLEYLRVGVRPDRGVRVVIDRFVKDGTSFAPIVRVTETAPGSKVPVVVNRNGQEKTFDITLGSMPANKVAKANGANGSERNEALAGVDVTDLDQNIRSEAPSSLR